MKAFEYLATQPWAVRPDVLEAARAIALREGAPEALQARAGREPDEAEGMSVRDGVAIIPVAGPIFRYASLFTMLCGGTTTEAISRDLRRALDDPKVHAILLDVDSPGGQATSIAELASEIRRASEAKPVVAYADGDCCSAAYWLASAAGEVVASPTALLGSIGVVWAWPRKKDDPKSVEFVSSQSPGKQPDVDTDAGRERVQALVDDLAEVFVSAVAANRGVDEATVLSGFGAGGVLVGAKAVAAGMADRVGSFEEVLAGLAAHDGRRVPPSTTTGRATGQHQETQPMSWTEKFRALMGEKPEGEAIPADLIPAASAKAPEKPAAPAFKLEDSPQYKALQGRLARLTAESQSKDREAFVAARLGQRVFPANKEAALAVLARLQADDEASPLGEGSRVALFAAFVDQAPSARVTGAGIADAPPAGAKAVAAGQPTEEDEAAASLEANLALTPQGRAILAQMKAAGTKPGA